MPNILILLSDDLTYHDLGDIGNENKFQQHLDLSKAEQFINVSKGRPWCLVVASKQPHTPWKKGNPAQYDPAGLQLPPYLVDTDSTRAGLARYYAEITYFDQQQRPKA